MIRFVKLLTSHSIWDPALFPRLSLLLLLLLLVHSTLYRETKKKHASENMKHEIRWFHFVHLSSSHPIHLMLIWKYCSFVSVETYIFTVEWKCNILHLHLEALYTEIDAVHHRSSLRPSFCTLLPIHSANTKCYQSTVFGNSLQKENVIFTKCVT